MISLKRLKEKSAAVKALVDDVNNYLPDNEDAEDLERNYDELYSMILDIGETLDCVLSDVKK